MFCTLPLIVRACVLILSIALGVRWAGAAGTESGERTITPELAAVLRYALDAKISPNGRYVAYVRVVPKDPITAPSGRSATELHVIYPNGSSRPFVSGNVNVGKIGWTPDGQGVSFLAKRGDDTTRSLYVIAIDGGEARKVLSYETDIAEYSWSPDGKRAAFIAAEPVPGEVKAVKDKGFTQQIYEEDFSPQRVLIGQVGDGAEKPRVLELDGFPSEIHWSPRGDRLALALAPTPLVDDRYMKRKVHVVDVATGKSTARFDNPGKLGMIAWSPSGEHLAFQSAEDLNDPSEGRLMVVSATGGALNQLEKGFEGDFEYIRWKDADTIAYIAAVGVYSQLGEIRKDGGAHRVLIPPGRVVLSNLSLSADGKTRAMLSEGPRHLKEVFVMSDGNDLPVRMTRSNPELDSVRFAKQEVVTYTARDGLRLQGILIRPLDEKPGVRYPLIVTVHGGPESYIPNGWLTRYAYPGQVGAARGFAVFYPNYRGSTGRGVAFSKMGQSDYAGKEFDDLIDAVDHFVATGLVDKSKVGITGGSYGGFASAWCATYHTERFAASVMFVGISNQISKSGTTDIPNEMYLVHARRKLYDHWQWFLERSPIYYAEKARTPLLILHGKEDTRVHPSQSMELYRHLKVIDKVPVRLVFYPGEGHGNRKSGARYDYNLRMLRWFEHYLKGAGGDAPAYPVEYAFPKPEKDSKAEEAGAGDAKK